MSLYEIFSIGAYKQTNSIKLVVLDPVQNKTHATNF